MKYENLILVSEVCNHYQLETTFIEQLDHHGLIERVYYQNDYYVDLDILPRVEKIIRFQNDLDINLEGVGVIFELLERIENLQQENRKLQNRLDIFDF
ncbi:MAG: chaperone modulator CbpM [Saprospiraceae bacterium]|nr:chaperone modulator CbpM [Saprospiraceae bacterium]